MSFCFSYLLQALLASTMAFAWTRPDLSRAIARKDSRVHDARRMWTSASRIRVRTTVPAWTILGPFDASACLVSTSLSIIHLTVLAADYVSLWRPVLFSLESSDTSHVLKGTPRNSLYFLAWPWTRHVQKHTFTMAISFRIVPFFFYFALTSIISIATLHIVPHAFWSFHTRFVVKVVITFGSAGFPRTWIIYFRGTLARSDDAFLCFRVRRFFKSEVVPSVGKFISPYGRVTVFNEEDSQPKI